MMQRMCAHLRTRGGGPRLSEISCTYDPPIYDITATGCDVINRWIIGTRHKYRALLESWAPPCMALIKREILISRSQVHEVLHA